MKENLQKRIAKYTAVAGAVVTATSASAQIVYTDVNPDYSHNADSLGAFSIYPLDLNNDATVDFLIASRDTLTATDGRIRVSLAVPYGAGNAVVGETPTSFDYALALDINTMVDATLSWIAASNTMAYNVDGNNPYNENWNGVTDKYLGLKFVVGGNTHYGWARLDVDALADSLVLKDYAYNATPNGGIMTGAMGVGLNEEEIEGLVNFVNQANNSVIVVVNGDLTDGVVNIISTTGQIISSGAVKDNTFSVDMNGLASGIYLVNVSFAEGSMTKKIIVH